MIGTNVDSDLIVSGSLRDGLRLQWQQRQAWLDAEATKAAAWAEEVHEQVGNLTTNLSYLSLTKNLTLFFWLTFWLTFLAHCLADCLARFLLFLFLSLLCSFFGGNTCHMQAEVEYDLALEEHDHLAYEREHR